MDSSVLSILVTIVQIALAPIVGFLALLAVFFLVLFLTEGAIRLAGYGTELLTSLGVVPRFLDGFVLGVPKFLIMMFKSLRRNLLRTSLGFLASFVLVFVITLIWSILSFIDMVQTEKSKNLKAIITEKFQIPSQMPPRYIAELTRVASELPPEMRADPNKDVMSWTFVGATLDPANRALENLIFFFALQPHTLGSMMDGLEVDQLTPADRAALESSIEAMQKNIRGVILGPERLKSIRRKVGDRITAYSFNYPDLVFDVEIIGVFPEGRYDQSACMNVDYFWRTLEDYKRKNGKAHPMEEKALNLFWVRLPTREAFEVMADRVNSPGRFATPSVKMETASSAISTFLDAYKTLIWGMRWLLAPAILATMALVIANAISISVRERRGEMAVLKVLGFRPWQVLILILGEALILGMLAGGLSTGITFFLINKVMNGLKFPIAFFPAFFVPYAALWWGPAIGAGTAFLGSLIPAWSVRRVKVSEVFSKVA